MELTILFILVIWMFVLQNKVVDLSKNVQQLKKYVEKHIINTSNTAHPQQVEKIVPQAQTTPIQKENIPVEPKKIQEVIEQNKLEPKTIKTTTKDDFDFQTMFLGNIFNKIGALAIIIAIIIFIKLVSPLFVFTPEMKMFAGLLFGIIMIAGALAMHKKENLKNYSEVLLGTGFADLFITVFCGYSLFHLYNTTVTIILGVILLIATYLIADRMKTLSMLIIGLIGGYLTPFFSGAENGIILGFLIFLNMISLIYTLRNKENNIINIINLVITMVIMSIYMPSGNVNIAYPVVLWAIYLIYDLIRNKEDKVDNTLSWVNYGILTVFTINLFKDVHIILCYMFGITALVYFGLSLFSRFIKNDIFKTYEYYILLNIWFLIFFTLSDIHSVISWALVSLILSFITLRQDCKHLNKMVIGFYFTTITAILLARYNGQLCLMAKYDPIINMRTLIFSIPIVSMFISAYLYRNDNKGYLLNLCGLSLIYLYLVGEINSIFVETQNFGNKFMIYTILGFVYTLQTKRLYITTKYFIFDLASYLVGFIALFALVIGAYNYQADIAFLNLRCVAFLTGIAICTLYAKWTKEELFKYIAIALGFLLCHHESVNLSNIYGEYIISLFWVLYAGIVTICGIIKNINYLKYSGIILSIMAIIRIFIYDLAKVDMLYKLIISLVLGIILMLVSYMYSQRKQ